MAYAEQIPSQHPNATEDEKVAQAGEILARLGMNQSTRRIAAEMGINRSTVFDRIKLINQPLPDLEALRVIHYERLESMFEGLEARSVDASNADYSRLRAEQRQVLARQSALLDARGGAAEPPRDDPTPGEDWEVAEEEHG